MMREFEARTVAGIHSERVRKNFKTCAKANAEKTALEIGAVQAANGMQMVATTLTIEQVRDAEVCFRRLVGDKRALSFYLEFALTNYRPPEVLKKLTDAVADYRAAKKRELDQDQLSILQNERIGSELKRLDRAFPEKLVADTTVPILVEFLEVGHPGMNTCNNRRGIRSMFFKFSFHRGWIGEKSTKAETAFKVACRVRVSAAAQPSGHRGSFLIRGTGFAPNHGPNSGGTASAAAHGSCGGESRQY